MTIEHVIVKVSGPDYPGITSKLMAIVAEKGGTLRDMGQAVTHGLLSLSFLLELEPGKKDFGVIKDLLFEAKRMGLELEFEVIDESWKDTYAIGEKFILNCVSVDSISASFVRDISKVLSLYNINIHRIDKVSPRTFTSLEMMTTVPEQVDWNKLKRELMSVSGGHRVDVAFLKDNVWRRNKRLIVFDMDSTLIQTEVIDEMADAHGVGPQIREITERAMNGEMDFNQSLIQRVAQLKGLKESKLKEILEKLPLTPGAQDFITTVKSLGYKVAVVSGGFTYFAHPLKEKLGLDFAFANELEIVDGELTGKIKGTIINAEQKATLVNLISQQLNINSEQVVAIGDGANDLPMLAAAGLGIAYHAKEVVRQKAGYHMSHGPMTTILYFLGIHPN